MAFEYRILVIPDLEPYQHGDPDDKEEVERTNRMIELDGVWGFSVEKREVQGHLHSDWESLDSCFGFIGNDLDYMLEEACKALPLGLTDVPIFETDPYENQRRHVKSVTTASGHLPVLSDA